MDWNKIYLVFLRTIKNEDQAHEAWLYAQLMEFDL